MNPCKIPKARGTLWNERHLSNVDVARNEKYDVVLIGDSIIANLKKYDIWTKFEDLNCVNFGIGGDRVENVLYRIKNGEISNETKIIVLFVGTNNSGNCKPWEIYEGILECILQIQLDLPYVHIILPTLLPKGMEPNKQRTVIDKVNEYLLELQIFESNRHMPVRNEPVQVVSIHENIVKNGLITRDIMYDFLHLTNRGYNLCFSPIYEKIRNILSTDNEIFY